MSVPQPPGPWQYGAANAAGSWNQPGLVPLRPSTVGDVLGTGWAVLRRHLVPLVGVALLVSALSAVVTLGTLGLTGSLQTFATAAWLEQIMAGGTSIPFGILLASVLGLLVSTVGAPVVAGLATAIAGAEALGRDARSTLGERLRGRWPVVLGVAAIVGVLVSVGLFLFVVPGVFAYLTFVLAAPAAVMERGSVNTSLRRSAQLTRGHRGRILGAVAVTTIAGLVVNTGLSSVAVTVVGQTGTVTSLLVSEFVSVLVGAFAAAWTGTVVAILYIDVRIRSEHLDHALRAAAAADRARITPPGQPGY